MLHRSIVHVMFFISLIRPAESLKAGPVGGRESLPSVSMNESGDFIISGPWRTQIRWKEWFFRLPQDLIELTAQDKRFQSAISNRIDQGGSLRAIICAGNQSFLFRGEILNEKRSTHWKELLARTSKDQLTDHNIRCAMQPSGEWAILSRFDNKLFTQAREIRIPKHIDLIDITGTEFFFIGLTNIGEIVFIDNQGKISDPVTSPFRVWDAMTTRIAAARNHLLVADSSSAYIMKWKDDNGFKLELTQKIEVYPTEDHQAPAISLAKDGSWIYGGYWGQWLGSKGQTKRLRTYIDTGRESAFAFAHSAMNGQFISVGPSDGDMGNLSDLIEKDGELNFTHSVMETGIKTPAFPSRIQISSEAKKDWWQQKIKLKNAWKKIKDIIDTENTIKIAVIDSGTDTQHQAISNRLLINPMETIDFVDNDQNGLIDDRQGYDFVNDLGFPEDKFGHGSHVTGLLSYPAFDKGIIEILSLRSLDQNGSSHSIDLARAINYAIEKKVDIINCSWGGGRPTIALRKAFEKATDQGIIVVTSAGNDKSNNDVYPVVPALFGHIRSVGAIDQKGQLASFSNWGKQSVDFLAPGVDIWSTYLSNTWRFMSGTSMAAPIVSRHFAWILAALKSAVKNKPLTKKQRANLAYHILCTSSQARAEAKCGLIQTDKLAEELLKWIRP